MWGGTAKKAKQDTQPFASGAHAVVWAVFERSARVDMAELTAGKRGDALRARDRLTETARGARYPPVETLVEAARRSAKREPAEAKPLEPGPGKGDKSH